jgi:hypothetical protein
MSVIPLDVQRRFERRWAARFVRQAPEPSSEKSEYNGSAGMPKPKGKPADLSRRVELSASASWKTSGLATGDVSPAAAGSASGFDPLTAHHRALSPR